MIRPSHKILIGCLTLLATSPLLSLEQASAAEVSLSAKQSANEPASNLKTAEQLDDSNTNSAVEANRHHDATSTHGVFPEVSTHLSPSALDNTQLLEVSESQAASLSDTNDESATSSSSEISSFPPTVDDRAAKLAHLRATSTHQLSLPNPSAAPANVRAARLAHLRTTSTQTAAVSAAIPVGATPTARIMSPQSSTSAAVSVPDSEMSATGDENSSNQAIATSAQTTNLSKDIPASAIPTTRIVSPGTRISAIEAAVPSSVVLAPVTENTSPSVSSTGEITRQASPQLAQSSEPDSSEPDSAAPPLVPHRIDASLQSGPSTGYERTFGSIYGFVPFSQTPGSSTFYGEGRFNLFLGDNDALGGNLRIGYRTLLPKDDLVLGGYVGWDIRNTDRDNTFHQIGVGADLQAENWEVRLNGYIPVGDTEQGIDSLSSNFFQGNQLLVSTTDEISMAGVDLEGGYRLYSWDDGNLYGYVGPYFLTDSDIGSYVGVRSRLQADFDGRFRAGVALSSDGNYGTLINLEVSATLDGGASRQSDSTPTESVVARLGEPVQRQDIIVIDQDRDTTVATNPATGDEFRFLHVSDGAVGGTGTFEAPFGDTRDAGLVAAVAENDIVYVDSGDRSGLSGFTIPDNVQVLSSGVPQMVTSSTGDNLQLPGTGTLPLVSGTVTMGNGTTLSGFEIQEAMDEGIIASNVNDVVIDRNQVTSVDNGITFIASNAAATFNNVTITDNSVTTSGVGADGIFVRANNTATLNNVTISGNSVSTSAVDADGIRVRANNATINNVTISDNSVSTAGINADGIRIVTNNVRVASPNGGTIDNLVITDNVIQQAGQDSVLIQALNPNDNICIAEFSGNTSSGPNFAGGGNDLEFDLFAGSLVNFVDFADVSINNTDFDDIFFANGPVMVVTACP